MNTPHKEFLTAITLMIEEVISDVGQRRKAHKKERSIGGSQLYYIDRKIRELKEGAESLISTC